MSLFSLPSPLLSSFLILLSTFFYFFVSYSPLIPFFLLFLFLLSQFILSHFTFFCLSSFFLILLFSSHILVLCHIFLTLSFPFLPSSIPVSLLFSCSLLLFSIPFYPFFPSYVFFSTFSLPSLSHIFPFQPSLISIFSYHSSPFVFPFLMSVFLLSLLSLFLLSSLSSFFEVPFPITSCHITNMPDFHGRL